MLEQKTVEITQVTIMHAADTFQRLALQGLSPETKRWYSSRLALITEALDETTILDEVTELHLLKLREKWERKRLAPDTLHGYIRCLRRFFRWLYKHGHTPEDLTQNIPLPRLPKRGRRGISDEHAQAILEEAKRSSVRDYAMLLVFATTSTRRGGVAGLKLSDLHLDEAEPLCRQMQVVEKGNKERTVVMDYDTYYALRDWMAVRPKGSDYVFVTEKGRPLSPSSVSEVIDRYKHRLGITGRCSPHQWRHRWFRQMLSNRMPITQAAQLGGHATIAVTYQFYGQFAMNELQEAYDQYHRITTEERKKASDRPRIVPRPTPRPAQPGARSAQSRRYRAYKKLEGDQ